ncbi:unnamed protein product [Amoebophrya sp. A25]|nr:unnamed protein product [Amoebophrya sp. A25]|eukprot:GSA25T00019888001.1
MKGKGSSNKGKGKAAPPPPPTDSRPKQLKRGDFRKGAAFDFAAEEKALQERAQQMDEVGAAAYEGPAEDAAAGATGENDVEMVVCPRCEQKVRAAFFDEHWSSHSSEILPFLFLGGRRNAENEAELIKRTQITHILNVAVELRDILPQELKGRFVEHTVPLSDSGDEGNFLKHARMAARWVHDVVSNHCSVSSNPGQETTGNTPSTAKPGVDVLHSATSTAKPADVAPQAQARVLLHCTQGVSRSAAVTIAYLMEFHGFRLEEAYHYVKARRKVIDPRPQFIEELGRLETEILYPLQRSCIRRFESDGKQSLSSPSSKKTTRSPRNNDRDEESPNTRIRRSTSGVGAPSLTVREVTRNRVFLNFDTDSVNARAYHKERGDGGRDAQEELKKTGLGGIGAFRKLAPAKKGDHGGGGGSAAAPNARAEQPPGGDGATPSSASRGGKPQQESATSSSGNGPAEARLDKGEGENKDSTSSKGTSGGGGKGAAIPTPGSKSGQKGKGQKNNDSQEKNSKGKGKKGKDHSSRPSMQISRTSIQEARSALNAIPDTTNRRWQHHGNFAPFRPSENGRTSDESTSRRSSPDRSPRTDTRRKSEEEILTEWRELPVMPANEVLAPPVAWDKLEAFHKLQGGSGGVFLYNIAGRVVGGKFQRGIMEMYAILLAQIIVSPRQKLLHDLQAQSEDAVDDAQGEEVQEEPLFRVAQMRIVHLFQPDSTEFFDMLVAINKLHVRDSDDEERKEQLTELGDQLVEFGGLNPAEATRASSQGGSGSAPSAPQAMAQRRLEHDSKTAAEKDRAKSERTDEAAGYINQYIMGAGRQFLGVLEVIKGVQTLQGVGGLHKVPPEYHQKVFRQLGQLCAYDAWMNNLDRVPLRSLWNNDGNLLNALIERDTYELVGIDQAVQVIKNADGAARYRVKLQRLCEEVASSSSAAAPPKKPLSGSFGNGSWRQDLLEQLYICTGVQFENVDPFLEGLRAGFRGIAGIGKTAGEVESLLAEEVENPLMKTFGDAYSFTGEEADTFPVARAFLLSNWQVIHTAFGRIGF